ncbi:MAG: bacterial Ig-like domain-containing protein [Lachnospiraceae bacterium]|nr:bacterial Ig-like domain-containing protein [Lachnospiraceae bacterium]
MKKGFAWLLCVIMLTGMLSSAASADPGKSASGDPGAGDQTVVTEPEGTVEIQYIMFTDAVWDDDGGEANGGYYFNVSFALSKAPENGTYSAEIRWLKQVSHNSAEEIESLKTVKELSLSKDNKTDSIQGLQMGVDTLALAGGGSGRYYLIVDLLYTGEDGSTKKVATNATDPVSITHIVKLTFKKGRSGHNTDKEITLSAGEVIKDMPIAPKAPDGFVFSGWKNETTEEFIDLTQPVTRGGTYSAVNKRDITVKYDYNHSGMGTFTGETDKNGKVVRVEPEVSAVGNEVFVDWYEKKNSKEKFNFNVAPTKDVTIYAGWGYSVAFDLSGHGNAIATQRVLEGDKFKMPEDDPSDENWEFAGWTWYKVDENGNRTKLTDKDFKNYNKKGLSCNLCLVAQWNEKITKQEIKLDSKSEYVYNFANVNVKVLDANGNEIPAEAYTISYKNGNGYDTDAAMNVGTYTATLALTEAGKNSYIIAEDGGEVSFKIVPKTIEGLVWSDGNFTYNGSAQYPTVTEVIGLCAGDSCEIHVVFDEAVKAGENHTARANGAKNTNYKLDADVTRNLEKKFSIAKRKVTFEWGDTTFTYDKKAHTPAIKEGSLDGFVEGDAVSYVITADKNNPKEVGNYTATFSLEGNSAENYVISSKATTAFSIVQIQPSITLTNLPENNTVQYGDTFTINYTLTDSTNKYATVEIPKINGKAVVSADVNSNKGTITFTALYPTDNVTITVKVAETTHHAAASESFELKITKRELKLEWGTDTFVYNPNKTQHPEVEKINGLVDKDKVDIDITGGRKDVGEGTAIATIKNGAYSAYYVLDESTASKPFNIIKADSSIYASKYQISKTYGEASFKIQDAIRITLNGGDEFSIAIDKNDGVAKINDKNEIEILGAGDVYLTLTNLGDDNYNSSTCRVLLKVSQKPVSIIWDNEENPVVYTWNGEEFCPTAHVNPADLINGDECSVIVSGGKKKAGDYEAIVTGLGNKNYTVNKQYKKKFRINDVVNTRVLNPNGYQKTYYLEANQDKLNKLNFNGMSITVTYKGGTKDKTVWVTESMVKYDPATLGKQDVIVTYDGQEFTFEIQIIKRLQPDWKSQSLTYNGKQQAPEFSVKGLKDGQSWSDIIEVTPDKNAIEVNGRGKTYTATAVIKKEFYEMYNFVSTFTSYSPTAHHAYTYYSIAPAKVTLSWNTDDAAINPSMDSAFECDYFDGSAVVAPKASLSGVVEGEDPLVLKITNYGGEDVATTEAVGEYKIMATLSSNNYVFAKDTKTSVAYRIINKVSAVDINVTIPQCGQITSYSVWDIRRNIAHVLNEVFVYAEVEQVAPVDLQILVTVDGVENSEVTNAMDGGTIVADAKPVTELEDTKVIEVSNWASLGEANSDLYVTGILLPQIEESVSDLESLNTAIEGIKDGEVKVKGDTVYSVLLFVTANDSTGFDAESIKDALSITNATVRISHVTNYGVIILADVNAVHNYDPEAATTILPQEDVPGKFIEVCKLNGKENHTKETEISALTVTKIEVLDGYKTGYYVNDAYDNTGLKIKVTLSDTSSFNEDVTVDMVSGFDSSTDGTKTLTITRKGKTVTFDVTVSKKQSTIDLKNVGDKVTTTYGDAPIDLVFDAVNGEVIISSADEKVAKVENGKLVIVGAGETTITLEIKDTNAVEGFKKSFKFVVDQKVVGLEWSKDNTFTEDGAKHSLTAKATGLVGTDSCDVIVEGGSTEVGTHTVKAIELSNKNYKLPENASTTFVINAKEEPKKEDSKTEELKTEEPKVEEPKKEEPKFTTVITIGTNFKVVYDKGDKFDPTGLTIEVVNEKGEKTVVDVTEDMVKGFDSSKEGDIVITIQYKDASKDVPIKIVSYNTNTFFNPDGSFKSETHRSEHDELTFKKLRGVYINKKLVDPKYYRAWSGSLHLLISADFMKSLPAGENELEILFEDGKSVVSFTVAAPAPSDASPVTGDTGNQMMWIILLAAAAVVLVVIRVYAAKRSNAE